MTAAREEALEQIAALVRQHGIGIGEVAARLKEDESPTVMDKGGSILKTSLGYVGGTFIFSGISLLINIIWYDINSAERVIITLGPGLIAFIMGALCLKDQRFEKAATPFFLIAACLQPFGIFVCLNEYFPQSADASLPVLAISGVMLAQQAMAFIAWRRSSLAFFSILFWTVFIGTAMAKMRINGDTAAIASGVSLLCLSRAADRTPHRAIAPLWYFIGTVGLLGGFFDLVKGSSLELSYLGLNACMIYLSIVLPSRAVLLVSVLGLMGWLGWYTDQYLANVMGWPIALIVFGFVMIGLSAYAVKLGRAIKTAEP
ncbi:MAG: hypothetical protein WA005_18985 [Candidatus Binataceae bacterium]